MHVSMQADGNAVDAQRTNWLVEVDLALLDHEALRLELVGDVRGSHRAEELALFADPRGERERHLLEFRRLLRSAGAALLLCLLQTLALLLDTLAIAGRRLICEAARQQIVARVAGRNLHDVPRMTEVLNCLSEYDFHCCEIPFLDRFERILVE